MPSLIDLRRRVRAVKNTQQITKAMKMVAASKLRRAQEKITAARPYAVQMQRVLAGLAGRVDASIHPLLAAREAGPDSRTLIIVVSADKGLCGSFNTNINKAAAQLAVTSPTRAVFGLIGRKGRDYFGRRGFEVRYEAVNIFASLNFSHAKAIADTAIEAFTNGEVDSVYLVYNEFRSVMSQKVVVDQLLPIARAEFQAQPGARPESGGAIGGGATTEYLFEPEPKEMFRRLLPRHVEVQVFKALLDSNAAFYAAQMTAMDAASRNAADMIESLTLYMNKVRQAAITREIIEVVSGAGAL